MRTHVLSYARFLPLCVLACSGSPTSTGRGLGGTWSGAVGVDSVIPADSCLPLGVAGFGPDGVPWTADDLRYRPFQATRAASLDLVVSGAQVRGEVRFDPADPPSGWGAFLSIRLVGVVVGDEVTLEFAPDVAFPAIAIGFLCPDGRVRHVGYPSARYELSREGETLVGVYREFHDLGEEGRVTLSGPVTLARR